MGVHQPGGGGGGGLQSWGEALTALFHGSGSPVGVVTPSHKGDLYVDDTTPAVWQATGTTNTSWAQVGGATPGAAIVRGPHTFHYNDAGLNTGVAFFTPTIGDVLVDVFVVVDTAFDGTTPLLDVGPFIGASTGGVFSYNNAALDVSAADFGALTQYGIPMGNNNGNVDLIASSILFANVAHSLRVAPSVFETADPWKLVVSQDGTKGGTAIGGTAGVGRLWMSTATPVAFS